MISWMQNALHSLVQVSIIGLEFIGVCVLLISAVRSIIRFCKQESGVRLVLAQGIALALSFKLGAEVLRTVVVREWNELLILGAIILLRAALTFLIHWEIKNEEKKQ